MMKTRLVKFAMAIFCLGCSDVQAQIDLNNQKTYGVWQYFGEPLSKKTVPEINGRLCNFSWKDIEPSPGTWVWDAFDAGLASRAKDSLPIIFMLFTKEMAPDWLYSNGVPKVVEKDKSGNTTGFSPYYADPEYKFYFKRMITAVRQHIETLPSNTRKYIIGVQACFGSTGDYISYKGQVDQQYELTSTDFFDLFKEFSTHYYNEYANTNPKIYLLSNPTYFGKEQNEWVVTNLPGSWLKCSNIGKGYQLNDERSKLSWLYPILNNPQPDGGYIRSRSEIIHSGLLTPWWDKIPYQNMFAIMSYSIHWGLDWSNQGYSQVADTQYDSAFHFFNKYAGQKNPLTSTNAMCMLKDVLDAADAVRFPAGTYGTVAKTATRYNNILAPYKAFGAKLEDVSNALLTEFENISATGINDVGWDLFPGNYERYLHQISPNTTSAGYWNVVSADPNSMYGRFARGFDISNGKTALYFDVENGFLGNKPLNGAYPVMIDIIYLDNGTGSWQLYYDAKSVTNKLAYTVNCTNSRLWKKASITINDAYFDNRAPNASDFYIKSPTGNTQNVLFSTVELTRATGPLTTAGLFSSSTPVFDTLCVNSTSAAQAITVSGAFLTQSVVTVGPKKGFTFAVSADGAYKDSLVFSNINASFSSPVYIKFTPENEGSFSGGIPLKGGGVSPAVIPVVAYAINSLPSISANVKNVSCFNARNGSIDLVNTGGTEPITYSWVNNTNNFKSASQDISGLIPSTYTVTINAYKGCQTSLSYTISQPAVLTAVADYETMICRGGTTTLTVYATGGTAPYSGTGTFTVNSGWKTYTVNDVNGCSDNVGITVANGTTVVPAKPGMIKGTTSDVTGVCESGSYEFYISPVAGATAYTWTPPAGSYIASVSNGGTTAILATTANYTGGAVSVQAMNNCGTSLAQIKTLSKTPVKPVALSGPTIVNKNQAGLSYSVPTVAGLTYTWTVPGLAKIISGQNTSAINVTWGNTSGNVTVKAINNCATSFGTSLYVNIGAGILTESSVPVETGSAVSAHSLVGFMVYPNPASDYASISFDSEQTGSYTLVITDLSGKKLIAKAGMATKGANSIYVDIHRLNRGMYIINLLQKHTKNLSLKLLKQ